MELLDRYLNFIRMLLPRGKQQDIITELSADLQAQIADKEAELGRPLEEAELEAILKQCGHPLLVAARYQAQQQLIGQPFYPLYAFGLKLVQWVLFPLLLVVGVVIAVFRSHPFFAMGQAVGDAITGAIYAVGVLTIAAVVLERLQTRLTFLDDWKPGDLPKLPAIPDERLIPRADSFGAFLGCAGFLAWWTGLLHIPQTSKLVFLNAIPDSFFWPVLALFVAETAVHGVNLLLPWWTRKRAVVRVSMDVYAIVLAVLLLRVWPWFTFTIEGVTPHELVQVEQIVNGALYAAVVFTILGYGVCLLKDLRRARGLPPFTKTLWTWLGWDGGH